MGAHAWSGGPAMRLWNAVIGRKVRSLNFSWNGPLEDEYLDTLSDAPAVLVQEIHDWYRRSFPPDSGPVDLSAFCARAQFPMMLFEHVDIAGTPTGVMLIASDNGDGSVELQASVGSIAPDGIFVFGGSVYWRASEEGALDSAGGFQPFPYFDACVERGGMCEQALRRAYVDDFMVAVCAMSFMNCRNVETRPVDTDIHRRSFERGHGRKPVRYHVLDIKPMRAALARKTGNPGMSLAKALHLCRGHFKDYTKRPLFGKYSGRFWCPPHARGDIDVGVVDKDYRVKAPEDEP